MTIELKNDYLTVNSKRSEGALSSIKDKDGGLLPLARGCNLLEWLSASLILNCGSVRDDKALFGQKWVSFKTWIGP